MRVVYDPERAEPWRVYAQHDLFDGVNWHAAFSRGCPPEILHTFFADLSGSLEQDVAADTEAVFIGNGQPVADAFQVLSDAGWRTRTADHDTMWAASSDDQVLVMAGPQRAPGAESADGALRFVWSVAPSIPEVSWSARFSTDTPALVMAAFNRAVLYPEPLVRYTSSLPEQVRERARAEESAAEHAKTRRPSIPTAAELLATSPGLGDSEFLLVPAHLAGPGDMGRAVGDLTAVNGWTASAGPTAKFWDSPCATVRIARLLRTDPEPSYRVRPPEGTWIITGAEAALAAPQWQMHLSPHTPAEVVGAVTSLLARAAADGHPAATARALNAHTKLTSSLIDSGWSHEELGHATHYAHPVLQVSYTLTLHSFSQHEELDHNGPSTHQVSSSLDGRLNAWTLTSTSATPLALISTALEAAANPEPVRRTGAALPQQFLPFVRALPPTVPRAAAARSGHAAGRPPAAPAAAPDPTTPRRRSR